MVHWVFPNPSEPGSSEARQDYFLRNNGTVSVQVCITEKALRSNSVLLFRRKKILVRALWNVGALRTQRIHQLHP